MSCPVEIVAEVANAHQGDPQEALRLAQAAALAGTDAVKFQIYFAQELLVRSHPRYEHFLAQAFAKDVWLGLIQDVRRAGVRVYCDVFGLDALDIAIQAGVDGLKIHSSDIGNEELLEAAAATGKKVYLSGGGCSLREIGRALRLLTRKSCPTPVLLHGFQSFPTRVEDSCLARLALYKNIFGESCALGYMDHVSGDDAFAVTLPLMALAMGATTLEKHITMDRAAKGVDYYSSLNPDEFTRFVGDVRRAASAIGNSPLHFTASERHYRQQMKKHFVAASDLPKGHILTPADLVMKRVAAHEAETVEPEKLLGRRLLHAVRFEEPLTRFDVEHTVWAAVVARSRSSRLPNKALLDIAGIPALRHLLERLKQIHHVDRIVFCTTNASEDDALVQIAQGASVPWHRGSTEDVLGRVLGAMEGSAVDVVLRITGDDILVDPEYADKAIEHHLRANAEYSDLKALPSGTEVELFDASLLRDIHRCAQDPNGTEYLTFYVSHHADQFRTSHVPVDPHHARDFRLTLDTKEDYVVIRTVLEAMRADGKGLSYRLDDVVTYFDQHPEVLEINARVRQRQAHIDVCTEINWANL